MITILLSCAYDMRLGGYFDYERKNPFIISIDVGEVLDREEQTKYNLFSGITDFESATFYEIEGGGYEVEIIAGHERLVAVNRDPHGLEILRDYIDRYDELQEFRAEFEEDWGILDYDDLGQSITKDEVTHVKGSHYAVGCGGCCLSLGGFTLYFLYSLARVMSDDDNINYGAFYELMAMVVAGTAGSASIGNRFDKVNALKRIKEARKPKVVAQ